MYQSPPIIPCWLTKIAAITIWSMGCLWAESSVAVQRNGKFVCEMVDGIPITYVRTARGSLPLIRWTKKSFNSFGYNPQQRCLETSLRLTLFHNSGQLKSIRSGTTHGYPVLCVDRATSNGQCSRSQVLLTFEKGVDPQAILRQLLDFRGRATKGAIEL